MQVLAVPAEPGGIEAVRVDKPGSLHVHVGGAQFTCFTSTKVQILTPEELCMCVCGSAH